MPRHSDYTPELAATICERLAAGESLRSICRDETMPHMATVLRWLKNHSTFSEQYAQAREVGMDAIADEVFDIADDGRNDWIERESQRTGQTYIALNDEAVARSKIRIDARKWYLSKLAPKKYGEKTSLELSGPDGGAIEVVDKAARVQHLLDIAASRKAKLDEDLDGLV